jgi:hypothetical protein
MHKEPERQTQRNII